MNRNYTEIILKILEVIFSENGRASCSRLIAIMFSITFLVDLLHSVFTKHILEVNMSAVVIVTGAWGLNIIQSIGLKNLQSNIDNALKQSKTEKYVKINYNK